MERKIRGLKITALMFLVNRIKAINLRIIKIIIIINNGLKRWLKVFIKKTFKIFKKKNSKWKQH